MISPKGDGARRWHERIDGIQVFRYPLPTTAAGSPTTFSSTPWPYRPCWSSRCSLGAAPVRRVHACNPPDFFFPIGWLFKRLGSAFIFDQHDLAPEVYVAQGGRRAAVHRFLLWCERRTYRAADAVIATNETYRRFALERGGVEPAGCSWCAAGPIRSVSIGSRRSGLKGGRPHLVPYLGTMGPQDGVDLFLERRSTTCRSGPARSDSSPWGRKPARPLRGLVDRDGLADDLVHGPRPDEYVRRVLSTADVAISPDPANDFNEYCTMNKTLEYMAIGLPVVAFDLEETRVSAGDAAVYATPNDRPISPRSSSCWTTRNAARDER